MVNDDLYQRADLALRTCLHTTVPLHAALVAGMARSAHPPLELATVLEDIGQRYVEMAYELNLALIRAGRLDAEPDPDDFVESRIEAYVLQFLAKAPPLRLHDGRTVIARDALDAAPFVADAVRVALLLASHGRGPPAQFFRP